MNEEMSASDYSEFMLLENKELATLFSVCRAEIFQPKENRWTALR